MPHTTRPQSIMAELGGKHMQHNTLVYEAGQRPSAPEDAVTRSTIQGGSGLSSSGETANEDDGDDDGSSAESDKQEDDEVDPDILIPSRGLGKGKGKCPAIRVESSEDHELRQDEHDATSHETGLEFSRHPVNQLLGRKKKRTFSNLSNTSVLFGDDEADQQAFPRRKMARKLSNDGFKPLLKYKEHANEDMNGSEHAIETDDEDYSGVNLVPDDDESDFDKFEQQEEVFIIQEEEQQATVLINQYNDARRLSLDSHASDNIFDLTAPLDPSFSMHLPNLDFGQFFEPEALPSSPKSIAKRTYSDSSTKRVRFDDQIQISDSSSTSSSELNSSLYPDLFLEQDKLPPSLSQLLENDNDEDNGDFDSPVSDLSFWDFEQDEPQSASLGATQDVDESSDAGSSGYESDLGDTTDEYESGSEVPPQTPVPKRSVLHSPFTAPSSKPSTPQPFQRSSRPTGGAIPPTRGIFIHDDKSKAIAVTNRTTKMLAFYRPRASVGSWISHGPQSSLTSTANNSPCTSLQQFNASDSEVSNEVFSNPFTTDIMFTGIFGSAPANEYFFGADSVGPPEAFYPFVSVGANGAIMDEVDGFEDDDYEDDLNVAEFMNFGDDADATDVDQEEEEGTDVPATPATSMVAINGSTPAQATPFADSLVNGRKSTSNAMLEHFDRGVVTAFRNNQTRYRDVACLPSDPSIRASVYRPIRSGKSAETVMTPLRKRPRSKRVAKSSFQVSAQVVDASSPLSGVTRASSRLRSSMMTSHRAPWMNTLS